MIGRIQARHRQQGAASDRWGATTTLPWQLRWVPVCGSTEAWLDRLLVSEPPAPLAVLAGHQRFSHGQRGRPWLAPPGGVWLSAALPWPACPQRSACLGLAVAVGLAQQLEQLKLTVELKWPNDLLLEGRKLAGLLPRLRLRGGRIREARVGVGLNGRNRVPSGAIGVADVLGRHSPASDPVRLAARVLAGLEWAVAHSGEAEAVQLAAERRLRMPREGVLWRGERWQATGLSREGGLMLTLGDRSTTLTRTF